MSKSDLYEHKCGCGTVMEVKYKLRNVLFSGAAQLWCPNCGTTVHATKTNRQWYYGEPDMPTIIKQYFAEKMYTGT